MQTNYSLLFFYFRCVASIDIILPCFNPPDGWSKTIAASLNDLAAKNPLHVFHLILVNDGSFKNFSEEEIKFLQSNISSGKIISGEVNKGKGFVLREGVKQSKSDFCIYTDVDFPYTNDSFQKIIDALLKNNCDIVAGVRGKKYYADVPAFRIWISKLLRGMIHFFLRVKITDTQCGLKGFNTKGKDVFLQTTINRYLFDLEFIFLASRKKEIRLQPIEVDLKDGIIFRKLNMKILFSEAWNFVKIFFRSLSKR